MRSDGAFVVEDAFDVVDVEDGEGYYGEDFYQSHPETMTLRLLLAYKCENKSISLYTVMLTLL